MQVGRQALAEVDTGRQSAQSGAGQAGFAAQEAGDLGRRVQQPAQQQQFRAVEHGALWHSASEGGFGVVEEDPWQGGSGIKDREHVRVQVVAGQVAVGAGGGPDGQDDGATAAGLGVTADGIEQGVEFQDSEGVLVHQRRGL